MVHCGHCNLFGQIFSNSRRDSLYLWWALIQGQLLQWTSISIGQLNTLNMQWFLNCYSTSYFPPQSTQPPWAASPSPSKMGLGLSKVSLKVSTTKCTSFINLSTVHCKLNMWALVYEMVLVLSSYCGSVQSSARWSDSSNLTEIQ